MGRCKKNSKSETKWFLKPKETREERIWRSIVKRGQSLKKKEQRNAKKKALLEFSGKMR